MAKKIILIILIFFVLFWACKPSNCDKEMDKKRSEYGEPEEVETYTSSDYNSVTWWYWSKGISFTFKWGSLIEKGCEVSTYTFPPIPAGSPAEIKAQVAANKKLVSKTISCDKNPINF